MMNNDCNNRKSKCNFSTATNAWCDEWQTGESSAQIEVFLVEDIKWNCKIQLKFSVCVRRRGIAAEMFFVESFHVKIIRTRNSSNRDWRQNRKIPQLQFTCIYFHGNKFRAMKLTKHILILLLSSSTSSASYCRCFRFVAIPFIFHSSENRNETLVTLNFIIWLSAMSSTLSSIHTAQFGERKSERNKNCATNRFLIEFEIVILPAHTISISITNWK